MARPAPQGNHMKTDWRREGASHRPYGTGDAAWTRFPGWSPPRRTPPWATFICSLRERGEGSITYIHAIALGTQPPAVGQTPSALDRYNGRVHERKNSGFSGSIRNPCD